MYLAIWSQAAIFFHCTIWSLAASFFLPFGPWRHHFFYHLIPGGKKCFIDPFGPWRQKGYKRVTPPGSFVFADLTPEGSHVSSHLVPGGNIFSLYHLVPGGIIFFTIWSLAASFFLPFDPWRHHFLIYPFEKMASIVFNFKIS